MRAHATTSHFAGADSPLAKRLFQTEGVTNVMLATDYIAVTKTAEADWLTLKPQLFASILDFYAAGEAAIASDEEAEEDSLAIKDDDTEVVQMIKELLDMRIRPSVQEDGGDIKFHGFDEETGVVSLEMQGSCSGCPSSSVTLKSGIENMLMHYIPEVKEVENVGADADGGRGHVGVRTCDLIEQITKAYTHLQKYPDRPRSRSAERVHSRQRAVETGATIVIRLRCD